MLIAVVLFLPVGGSANDRLSVISCRSRETVYSEKLLESCVGTSFNVICYLLD
jgi:hypothetical protein